MLEFPSRSDLPAVSVEIRAGFMSHTFTEACRDGAFPDANYSAPGDPRIFSLERYRLSHSLPAILDTIDGRRCYISNSGYGNHFVIEGLHELPPSREYWVFLQLERVDRTIARLRIRSAYAGRRDQAPYGRGRKSMMFRELLTRTLGLKARR